MSAPDVFTFTTGAGAQLSGTAALSTVPASGATGVVDNVAPTVTFSNPIDPITAPGNVTLTVTATSVVVPSTLTYSTDFKTVSITPNAPLTSSTSYTISTNSAVTDQTGNRATQTVSNSFTAQ
jgi:hypothetical protein